MNVIEVRRGVMSGKENIFECRNNLVDIFREMR